MKLGRAPTTCRIFITPSGGHAAQRLQSSVGYPTARYHVSTLTRALETCHRNASGEKPDPAHRLDRETSGLVACGRSPLHTRALKAAFAARQVEKAYLALCEGEPRADEFQVDVPLSVGTVRIKVKVKPDPQGMPAVTA